MGTIVIGAISGLVAVGFQLGIRWMNDGWLNPLVRREVPWAAILAFLLMAGGALIAGILMTRYCPDAAGSGIPQVKSAYERKETLFSWKIVWVKFIAGVVSIGGGSSLGREGPTVHICAALASKVSKAFGESRALRGTAVCAGSAAGLAAAFNSPLAGVTFVMEEIVDGENPKAFVGRSLLAAALAVLVVFVCVGDFPALPLGESVPMRWSVVWLSPVVALLAGLSGLWFQWATVGLRKRSKASRISPAFRPAIGAGAAFVFGLGAYMLTGRLGVFGLGETDLLSALHFEVVWWAALVLLAAKLAATVLCYGSGGCGGIFAPLLFFGGMCGTLVAASFQQWLALTPDDAMLLTVIGMTSCLCAVVRAPLTSILIVVEMTRQIYALPALMVAAVICTTMSKLAFRDGIYDAFLRQDGER